MTPHASPVAAPPSTVPPAQTQARAFGILPHKAVIFLAAFVSISALLAIFAYDYYLTRGQQIEEGRRQATDYGHIFAEHAARSLYAVDAIANEMRLAIQAAPEWASWDEDRGHELLARRKTGALLQASVLMGAACGHTDARAWQALSDYGAAIGLAFQVVDDILDVTQASETLGKTAGKDLDANKPTYVSVLGLDRARERAAELHAQAQAALAASGLTAAHKLAMLADKVVDRES